MGRALRSEELLSGEISICHCVQRCVRRAWFAGVDPVSGNDYSYRREWIRRRMEALASVIGVAAFIIMTTLGCRMRDCKNSPPQQVDPSSFPSADDPKTLFNARLGMGLELEQYYHPDRKASAPYRYVNTMATPKEVTEDYVVKSDFIDISFAYYRSTGLPPVDDGSHSTFLNIEQILFRGEAGGLFEPIDRTLEIALDHVEKFSPQYIHHIASTLLTTHPHWRLHILGYPTYGERTLTVYKDAVVIGDKPYRLDESSTAITEWQQHILDLREQREGPRRRARRIVKHRAPTFVKELEKAPIVIVAAFNHCNGDTSKHSFWVMRKFEIEYFVLASHENVSGGGGQIYVNEKGGIVHYDQGLLLNRIIEHAIYANDPHEIVFRKVRRNPNGIGVFIPDDGPEFRVTIPESDLLSDEDARRLLGDKSVFLLE